MSTQTKSRKGIGGPKTKEGKERIRLNALKMGLHANSLAGMQAVADVIGVTFESIHEEMREYHQPKDVLEEALVRRIARSLWKLRLVEAIEDNTLQSLQVRYAPNRSMETLSVMERRSDAQLHRALHALAAKRMREQENVKNKLTEDPAPSAPQPQPEQQPTAEPTAIPDIPMAIPPDHEQEEPAARHSGPCGVRSCRKLACVKELDPAAW